MHPEGSTGKRQQGKQCAEGDVVKIRRVHRCTSKAAQKRRHRGKLDPKENRLVEVSELVRSLLIRFATRSEVEDCPSLDPRGRHPAAQTTVAG